MAATSHGPKSIPVPHEQAMATSQGSVSHEQAIATNPPRSSEQQKKEDISVYVSDEEDTSAEDEKDAGDGRGYSRFSANQIIAKRYQILSRLGSGSFAEVYCCKDITSSHRGKLALKVIRSEWEFRHASKYEFRFLNAVKDGIRMPELLDYFTIRVPIVAKAAEPAPTSAPVPDTKDSKVVAAETSKSAPELSTSKTASDSNPSAKSSAIELPKFRRYRCLVFACHQLNLSDFIKGYAKTSSKTPDGIAGTFVPAVSQRIGIPPELIRILGFQLLEGLDFLSSSGTGLVHCDIKPANLMIDITFPASRTTSTACPESKTVSQPTESKSAESKAAPQVVKTSTTQQAPLVQVVKTSTTHVDEGGARLTLTIIDFGSASLTEQLNENYRRRIDVLQRKRRKPPKALSRDSVDLKYRDWWFGPYLQSRFYRAPETILGNALGCAIDWFSAGTVLWEMATGRPLFAAKTPHHLLWLYVEVMGPVPPEIIESMNEYARDYFFHLLPDTKIWSLRPWTGQSQFVPFSRNLSSELMRLGWIETEAASFTQLIGFLLQYDPKKRLTPAEALSHDFFIVA